MKNLFSFLAIASLSFFLFSCEQCSECTTAEYLGTCDCTGFFGDGTISTDTYLEHEVESAEFSCSFSFCLWSAVQTGQVSEEVCGRKKDVEEEVSDLERDDWDCTSPSR